MFYLIFFLFIRGTIDLIDPRIQEITFLMVLVLGLIISSIAGLSFISRGKTFNYSWRYIIQAIVVFQLLLTILLSVVSWLTVPFFAYNVINIVVWFVIILSGNIFSFLVVYFIGHYNKRFLQSANLTFLMIILIFLRILVVNDGVTISFFYTIEQTVLYIRESLAILLGMIICECLGFYWVVVNLRQRHYRG